MGCSRCGGGKTPRPATPPSSTNRPGSAPRVTPTTANPGSNTAPGDAHSAITGLRYVPSSNR